MKRRIGMAGIVHETNSYCWDETPVDEFLQLRGDTIAMWPIDESTKYGYSR